MKKYEVMCVFAPQDKEFADGLSVVKDGLSGLGAEIEKEEDMGVRKIAGAIKKHTHAHYLYFILNMEPQNARQIREKLSLIPSLIRVLVIKWS